MFNTVRLKLSAYDRNILNHMLNRAEEKGDLREVKRILTVLSYADDTPISVIAAVLKVNEKSVSTWIGKYLISGAEALKSTKPPGRKPKLSKDQKRQLSKMIEQGPNKNGFPGACWRSPMIQNLILREFNVFYSAVYISELLKNMGFSFQKARFIPARRDHRERKKWQKEKWHQILSLSKRLNAMILFGDEASFPQWGSLSYTWSKKGVQPVVKTSGIRRAYKVFGLIEYYSGRFFFKCHEGRLNSESYISFLKDVMKKARRHIIVIQDKAPYHTSKMMKEFQEQNKHRLTIFDLPSYSPDFNPIEMLWKKIKEKEIHLHYFPTFNSLKKRVNEALVHFQNLKEEVLALFGFYDKIPTKKDFQFTINLNISFVKEIA